MFLFIKNQNRMQKNIKNLNPNFLEFYLYINAIIIDSAEDKEIDIYNCKLIEIYFYANNKLNYIIRYHPYDIYTSFYFENVFNHFINKKIYDFNFKVNFLI
jgi:hypothetical protein